MKKTLIEKTCRQYARELLEEYCPSFAQEAAVKQPEKFVITFRISKNNE